MSIGMKYRASDKVSLGNDVEITRMGIGCSPMGGAMGIPTSDRDIHAIVAEAHKQGLAYYDVSPHYGQGYAEERLGKELTALPRDSFAISTKVGISLVPGKSGIERGGIDFYSPKPFVSVPEFTRDAVARSLENSLRRLQLQKIDIALIHDPDEAVTLTDPHADPYSKSHFREVMTQVYPYLEELRSTGVIGAVGIGINQWQMLRDFARAGNFDCFLLARQYTLLEHIGTVTRLLPILNSKRTRLIIGGIYHNGILATGSRTVTAPWFDMDYASEAIIHQVQKIEEVCSAFRVPLQAAALQFPFGSQAVASIIPGVRNEHEIRANIDWFHYPIPFDFWTTLKERQLIHEAA